ncbi:MAG TPA: hypothetical protein VFZ52_14080 [Chryseolinea sp.]
MKTRSQIVAEQRLLLSFLPHVRAQFGTIPGVEIVGLGAKEKRGKICEEWAFRFYVRDKLPLRQIPENQRIPDRIFGIQTDVIAHFEKASLVCESTVLSIDTKGYRDNGIRGGISIRNEHFNNDQPSGYGTLGILARRKSDNALVGLTCSHVVNAASESPTTLSTKIGQPKYWMSCCCCPHGYIGDVAKATSTNDLDCAIIDIHDDLLDEITSNNTENVVEGIVGSISGAAAIVCFETLSKRGRATGLTTGKVSEVAYGTNQMLIEKTGGNPGDPFACHGDSGSVIVNSGNQVVGLLVAASRADLKKVIATHIKPVMLDLGITIAGTDAATIGEPVGGGATGCELSAWPGGHADTALNPVEIFDSTDFEMTGPVNWDVSGGRPGAVIVETGTQTAAGLESISVRYDTVSPSKNPTDAVWIKAAKDGKEITKFRTIFQFVARTVNTSSLLDSSNNLRFAATGGTDNTQCGVAVPGTNGATWFLAKAETVYDIGPQDLAWNGIGSISFVTGAALPIEGNIVARRETKFTRGDQATGAANRTHTDQATFISAGDSSADDFQAPTDAAPNELFRIANEGFDPTNLLQGYLRADYRDYLEFHNGAAWIRITPYQEWHANLTATLNGAGTAPPGVGSPNTIDVGASTEKVPNEKPTIVVTDFVEVKPGEQATLSVTSTADPDNDVRSVVTWVQTAGPAVALSSTTGNSVTFNAPANDPQLVFSATIKDSTETLSRTAGNFMSDPAVVTVNVIEWLNRNGGNARLCVNNQEVFNAADFGIGAGALNWDVTTGGAQAVIIEADGASVAPTGTVAGALTITVNYNNVSADATRANSVKIQATNPANGKVWYRRRTVLAIAHAVVTSVAPGAAPSNALGATTWGLTFPENVTVTICAYRAGGNWQAALLTARGNYSLQSRLLAGVTEVTGPGGNTNIGNFCDQMNHLNALGNINNVAWYMVSAVTAHENVHASRFLPAFNDATVIGVLTPAIEALTVPHVAGMTQATAIAAIQASPGFAAALTAAQANWLARILILVTGDHAGGGPADVAEHAIVDPMVTAICAHRNANGWPACPPLCP